jgi:apolipoprotein N-acyltransferase
MAGASGILLALSFPRYGQPALAWVALAPLIVSLFASQQGFRRARAFLLGFVAGLGYFGGTVYWTGTVVTQFGGLAWPVGVVVGAVLVAYLALFPALFSLCLGWLRSRYGDRAILLAPAVWVTTELGRTYFWSGFPWLLLGYSQATVLPIAQFASVAGVFGLSALVALVSTALAYLVVSRSARSLAVVGATAAALIALTAWGHRRVENGGLAKEGRQVRVALIQGNIPQDQKWDAAHAGSILNTYLSMTREAAGRGAQLVIWPESSTPFPFLDNKAGGERIRALVRETGIELLLGSDQVDHQTRAYYNAAFLVRKDGDVAGVYQKMHLVPFGEFVPPGFNWVMSRLDIPMSNFSRGRVGPPPLEVAGQRVAVNICYEDAFGEELIRQLPRATILANFTNDAWWGESFASEQHLQISQMRALETGRYMLRATNTGVTAIIDPRGRVEASAPEFERAVLTREVRGFEGSTPFVTAGNYGALALCAALAGIAFAAGARSKR